MTSNPHPPRGHVRPSPRLPPGAVAATKRYGSGDTAVTALDDVTVDFNAQEFTAIMGPSGSGKSTLMHNVAGLDTLTSGSVYIGDTDLSKLDDKRLTKLRRDKIGFIFQAFNLIPTLTALENITLPMSLAGRKPDQAWLDHVVATVGLSKRLGHRPSELSGGQQQRVAVARALAGRPEIIFGDEPTGNLDSRTGAEILSFMRTAVQELGQTIVMVTHDPVAASYAQRVLFLADGSHRRRDVPARRPSACSTASRSSGTDHHVQDHPQEPVRPQAAAPDHQHRRHARRCLHGGHPGAHRHPRQVAQRHRRRSQRRHGRQRPWRAGLRRRADGRATGPSRRRPGRCHQRQSTAWRRPRATSSRSPRSSTRTASRWANPDMGAPVIGGEWLADETLNPFSLVEGRAPEGDHEVVIDAKTAETGTFAVGDPITVLTEAGPQAVTVAGIAELDDGVSLGGAQVTMFSPTTAQAVLTEPGKVDAIKVLAEDGVSQRELADRIEAAVPEGHGRADRRRARRGGAGRA